jgi:ribosome maturation factor RimP
VSRPLSDALDEQDPIEGSYVLEVGSAGADRALRKPEHFAAYLGSEVDVKLYRPRDGRKEFTGTLAGYEDGAVTLQIGADAVTFEKKEIALVRLHITL